MFITYQKFIESMQPTPADVKKFCVPTGSAEEFALELYERIVRVDDSSYTTTIVLPPVAEAKGLTYFISVSSGSHDCTVVAHGGATYPDARNFSSLVLTADEDHVAVMSNGVEWVLLVDVTT